MTPSTISLAGDRNARRLGHWPGHGRALAFAGVGLLIAVMLAIGTTVWDLRRIAVAEAVSNTENLAIVLAEQTSHSIQAVDIVLREVLERIAALDVTTPAEFRRILAADPSLGARRRARESALAWLRRRLGPTRYARWRRSFLGAVRKLLP